MVEARMSDGRLAIWIHTFEDLERRLEGRLGTYGEVAPALRELRDRRTTEADTGRAQDQRAEFEAWITAPPHMLPARRFPGDSERYFGTAVQLAWEAWQQARKAQEPQRLPGVTAAELAEFIRCAPNAYVRVEAQRESAGDRHGEAFYAPLPSAAKIAAALAQEPQPAGALEWREAVKERIVAAALELAATLDTLEDPDSGVRDAEDAGQMYSDAIHGLREAVAALSGDGTRQGEEGASGDGA